LEGDPEFTIELAGHAYTQPPQKYHAKSLAALRARYAEVSRNADLAEILRAANCLPFLKPV
jgi:hypothetical protein